MKFIGFFIICTLFLQVIGIDISAQNAKQYFKTGEDFLEENQFEQAITYFSRAIQVDPEYEDAYLSRALAFEKTGNIKDAANDYMKACRFFEKETEVHYNAGRLLYQLGQYPEAIKYLNTAIEIKNKNLEAVQMKVLVYMEMKDYYKALRTAKEALDLKKNAFNYYYHGLASEYINIRKGAMDDYKEAIAEDENYIPAYVALARLQLEEGETENALANIEFAIKHNPEHPEGYLIRSKINKVALKFPQAINDISKAIVLSENSPGLYLMRAKYYTEFTQYQNAIADFNKVVQLQPDNTEALYLRAQAYAEISEKNLAVNDYRKLIKLLDEQGAASSELRSNAEKQLFELNRESKEPELTLVQPVPVNNLQIEIPKNQQNYVIKGTIKDDNPIDFLKINDQVIDLVTIEDNIAEFNATVSIDENELITFSTADIYQNTLEAIYTVKRTEIESPEIAVLAPYASENDEIFLSEEGPYLYVEGKIKDESLIEQIMVDDVMASYRPEDINPSFSATLDISNKDNLTIKVVDQFGNEAVKQYHLNKNHIATMETNPMGKTWVVFIENSTYSNFAGLEGPATDVTLMKSALANYQISNIIHKQDMTKHEMERFFSIELRDLVRSNRVNSIMIWYAGHGLVINETGYWIPVDAKIKDEFSYFNINALKASMQSYSRNVTHTLVITDACESGPTFFQAMRSAAIPPECGDWKSTKFKSSQVFTSAGNQSASDDSQFTRTFASTLSNNPNGCIAIEEIVQKVTSAVSHVSNQKPRFGKISGLEDEDGTFFFIAKE